VGFCGLIAPTSLYNPCQRFVHGHEGVVFTLGVVWQQAKLHYN